MLVFLSQSLFKTSKTKIILKILKYTIMRKSTGRAKPVTPKAGVTKTSRRCACGGKLEL